jgi:hypothetical protein
MMASVQQLSPKLQRRSSLLALSARDVNRGCEEAIELMELVAELLLLRSGSKDKSLHPVNQSSEPYASSRDAIVANTKALAISIKDITRQLKEEKFFDVEKTVQIIADKVTVLIEAASHAAYIAAVSNSSTTSVQPALIDQYSFAKSRLIITNTCKKLSPERRHLTSEDIMELTQTIANHLKILRQNCKNAAANKSISEMSRDQFNSCIQSLDGSSTAFVTSVKGYITSGQISDQKKIGMFSIPLTATVNTVASFAGLPEFAGHITHLDSKGEQSQTEILASAMAVVSSTVQMLHTVTGLIDFKVGLSKGETAAEDKSSDERHWHRLVSCTRAVADSCKMLATAIKQHTPLPSPLAGTPQLQRDE